MSRVLRINRVAVHRFGWEVAGLAPDEHNGFNQVYRAGSSCLRQTGYVLTIGTDGGPVGEYVGGTAASYARSVWWPSTCWAAIRSNVSASTTI